MLLQMGLTPAMATLCSAILFVPWVLKSFMRPWVSRVGHFRLVLHLIEALLSVSILLLAFSFGLGPVAVFLALLLVSLLCAWHELAARMCYESSLRPAYQRLLTVPKHICSQVTVIFTYGALIFLVGTLQVYFRQMIRYSWSLGCYVATGLFLLFGFLHLIGLQGVKSEDLRMKNRSKQSEKQESESSSNSLLFLDSLEPRRSFNERSTLHSSLLILFLLLLPQALMFFTRVLYLYSKHVQGGLQCTMQEIGFAQGTVGVIAFSLGIAIGRRLIRRYTLQRLFWSMALCIVLSPFVYLGMTLCPPESLWELCCCTLTAQLLFGLGIGVCRLPISAISGTRYRNTINMLQIPLVSVVMIVPMAISGWMVEQLGFDTFFLINALSAPVCLLGVFLLWKTAPVASIQMETKH